MNETISCNKCGREFTLDEYRFGIIKKNDFVVQYFSCPACGERYHVFTSDPDMRELVRRREAVQAKIRAGHVKKFREKTLVKYARELEQIKQKQEKIMPTLKAIGEKLLHENDQQKSSNCDTELEKMWDELSDIPFDDPGEDQDLILAEDWRCFKKGTAREDIWHWFDGLHSKGVAYLLNGSEGETP